MSSSGEDWRRWERALLVLKSGVQLIVAGIEEALQAIKPAEAPRVEAVPVPLTAEPQPAPSVEVVEVEVRYCVRPGCGREIPRFTSKGVPLKPSQYASRVYCSQRCSGLVSGSVRKAKAAGKVEVAESVAVPAPEPPAPPTTYTPAASTRYCETCSKPISRVSPSGHRLFPSEYARKRYCSMTCARAARLRSKADALVAEASAVAETVTAAAPDARRERLEAAKAARRARDQAVTVDSVLAVLAHRGDALSQREVVVELAGKVNDRVLDLVKSHLRVLVAAGRVEAVRGGGEARYQAVVEVEGGVVA